MKNYKELDQLVQNEIEEERLQGASLVLNVDGRTIFEKAYGSYSKQSIYRIYSMTKIITAIAVMKLWEQKALTPDMSVAHFYPDFQNYQVYDGNEVIVKASNTLKIQHLLNMTSGMGYPMKDKGKCHNAWYFFEKKLSERLKSGAKPSTAEICSCFSFLPGAFEPGTKWQYGASADLLGGIVEKASGMEFDNYLKKYIFEPMEIKECDFFIPESKLDRLAQMYSRDCLTGKVKPVHTRILKEADIEHFTLPDVAEIRTVKPVFLSGGAGLYCSIQDYLKILEMLLHDGDYCGERILQKETVEFFRKDQLTEDVRRSICEDKTAGINIDGYSYSNLVRIMKEPGKAYCNGCIGNIGEYGWDGLPGNYCLIDPKENMIFIFMIQIAEGPDMEFRSRLRQALYQR